MIKLIFIRHPETKWSKQKKYLGKTDISLSLKGQGQAKLLSNYLKNEDISVIYSSRLKRALETAAIIAKSYNLKMKTDAMLDEIDFGEWEGMTFKQLQKRYSKLVQTYLSDPLNAKFPSGESLLEFKNRVDEALEEILARERGTVVIVSHAGVNRISICSLLNLPISCFWQIKQDIGAINIVEIYQNTNIISLINHTLWGN